MKSIGEWVRAARASKGWNQEQLGEALGVSKANVSHWETNKHEPSFGQLLRIRDATGFPLSDVGPATDWPLPNIPRERITNLTPEQLITLQAGITGLLAALGHNPTPAIIDKQRNAA